MEGSEEKIATISVKGKLNEGDSRDFTTRRKKIREELRDTRAGTLMVQKFLAVIEKQEEKIQQIDEEIRKQEYQQ